MPTVCIRMKNERRAHFFNLPNLHRVSSRLVSLFFSRLLLVWERRFFCAFVRSISLSQFVCYTFQNASPFGDCDRRDCTLVMHRLAIKFDAKAHRSLIANGENLCSLLENFRFCPFAFAFFYLFFFHLWKKWCGANKESGFGIFSGWLFWTYTHTKTK